MHKRSLKKPDGRSLWLYSREPIPDGITAPSPVTERAAGSSHLRWDPLRSEWVAYATHRQGRTFLPPPELLVLGYLRNQRFVNSLEDVAAIQVDWEVNAVAVVARSDAGLRPSRS